MAAATSRRRDAMARARCRGVTLVEVLIALVVLSLGLLGLASLQTVALQFNTSAYYRTQATALAYGLVDRMRADRDAARNGAFDGGLEDPPPACDPNAAASGATPAEALAAWRNTLACELPEATGSVVRAGDEFTITVQWDDSRGQEAPLQFEFATVL